MNDVPPLTIDDIRMRRSPTTVDLRCAKGGAVMECAVYLDGIRLPRTFSPPAAVEEVRRLTAAGRNAFVGLSVEEPDEDQMIVVGSAFDLGAREIEDALQVGAWMDCATNWSTGPNCFPWARLQCCSVSPTVSSTTTSRLPH
jgi:hypothetical protein